MSPILVPTSVVEETLTFLRESGADRNAEGVALWLGKRLDGSIAVSETYIPKQIAAEDYFRIPSDSMAALLRHLGETRTFIAAQVHSHPQGAFHSYADDTWAIVRHVGALSIVVPDFARGVSGHDFISKTASFCLSRDNTWDLVPPSELGRILRVV